jgi:hypothetical protein
MQVSFGTPAETADEDELLSSDPECPASSEDTRPGLVHRERLRTPKPFVDLGCRIGFALYFSAEPTEHRRRPAIFILDNESRRQAALMQVLFCNNRTDCSEEVGRDSPAGRRS